MLCGLDGRNNGGSSNVDLGRDLATGRRDCDLVGTAGDLGGRSPRESANHGRRWHPTGPRELTTNSGNFGRAVD